MRFVFKIAAIGFALVIVYLSLQPATGIAGPPYADKVQHFLAYGTLTALCAMGWPSLRLPVLVIGATLMGGGVEIAQGLSGQGRTPSIFDALANGTGAIVAALIMSYIRKLALFRSA